MQQTVSKNIKPEDTLTAAEKRDIEARYESTYDTMLAAAEGVSLKSTDTTKHGVVFYRFVMAANGQIILQVDGEGANKFHDHVDLAPPERMDRDKGYKYELTFHSETKAIHDATLKGSSIKGSTMVVPCHPCKDCMSMLAEAGVKRVVMDARTMTNDFTERWAENMKVARQVAQNAGIEIIMDHQSPDNTIDDIYRRMDEFIRAKKSAVPMAETPIVYEHHKPEIAHLGLNSGLKKIIGIAEMVRKESPWHDNPKGAVIYDDHFNVVLSSANHPPKGTDPAKLTPDELPAYTMSPGRIMAAQAVGEGVSLAGKHMYATYHPRGQEAIVLAGAGLKHVHIDAQSLNPPHGLDYNTARGIWAAAIIFKETGMDVHFQNITRGQDPYASVAKALGPDMIKISQAIHEQFLNAAFDTHGLDKVIEKHRSDPLDFPKMTRDDILYVNPETMTKFHHSTSLDFRLQDDKNPKRTIKPGQPIVYILREQDLSYAEKDIGILCHVREIPPPHRLTFNELTASPHASNYAMVGSYRDPKAMAHHAQEIYGGKLKPDSALLTYVVDPVRPLTDAETVAARARLLEVYDVVESAKPGYAETIGKRDRTTGPGRTPGGHN